MNLFFTWWWSCKKKSFKLLLEQNCEQETYDVWKSRLIIRERIMRRATEWNTLLVCPSLSTPTPETHLIRRLMRGIKKPQAWRGLAWHINPSKSLPAGCLPAGGIDVSRKKERRTDSEESEKLISGKRLSFSENGKLENSGPAYIHLYTRGPTACEWQTLNEKEPRSVLSLGD